MHHGGLLEVPSSAVRVLHVVPHAQYLYLLRTKIVAYRFRQRKHGVEGPVDGLAANFHDGGVHHVIFLVHAALEIVATVVGVIYGVGAVHSVHVDGDYVAAVDGDIDDVSVDCEGGYADLSSNLNVDGYSVPPVDAGDADAAVLDVDGDGVVVDGDGDDADSDFALEVDDDIVDFGVDDDGDDADSDVADVGFDGDGDDADVADVVDSDDADLLGVDGDGLDADVSAVVDSDDADLVGVDSHGDDAYCAAVDDDSDEDALAADFRDGDVGPAVDGETDDVAAVDGDGERCGGDLGGPTGCALVFVSLASSSRFDFRSPTRTTTLPNLETTVSQ